MKVATAFRLRKERKTIFAKFEENAKIFLFGNFF